MSGSEQDYGASDVDLAEPRSNSSDLKVHFKVSGLALDNSTLEDIEASVVEQFEIKAGPVQRQFVRTEVMSNTACIYIGLSRDSDAVEFFSRKEQLREICDIQPVEIFKPYLEQNQIREAPKKNISPPQAMDSPRESKPRRRSRSPRVSSALMAIACPPLQIKDSDVLQELSRLEVMEVPKIEYIFSNVKESELILKLMFKEISTVEYLVKKELELKGKPVLAFEPSLKNDIEKSVKHAIFHHQIRVLVTDDTVTSTQLSELLSRFGKIAHLENQEDAYVITYSSHKSARQAIETEQLSFQNAEGDKSTLKIRSND